MFATPILFPLSSLPCKVQEIIEQVHHELNYPVNYAAASMLLAAAVAIGNSKVLRIKAEWIVKPIFFMALIGEPGSLKTHPINFALKPFERADAFTLSKYEKELDDYRRNALTEKREKPKARQYIIKDFTFESIEKVLKANPNGICVHADELKGWIESFNKYRSGGGDLEQWLSLFNGLPLVVNRKSLDDVIYVNNPYVSVIGSMQPGVLEKAFKGEKKENGFLSRILFVNNSSANMPLLWKGEDLPITAGDDWESILNGIMEASKPYNETRIPQEYCFDNIAWDLMMCWQNDKERDLSLLGENHEIEIFRKIQDYALRFCLPIHSLRVVTQEIDESSLIDCVTVTRAIEIAEYFYHTAREVHKFICNGDFEDSKVLYRFLDTLPLSFTTAQAMEVGRSMGISPRTIYRYLDVEKFGAFIKKKSHGRYEKKI